VRWAQKVAGVRSDAPIGTTAIHETDGQLIPNVRLVTVPPTVGETVPG